MTPKLFHKQRAGGLNVKGCFLFCEWKKIRRPGLRTLALFYTWGDARVWAHGNHSFDTHLGSLGPPSCGLHILGFLGAHLEAVAAAGWPLDGR